MKIALGRISKQYTIQTWTVVSVAGSRVWCSPNTVVSTICRCRVCTRSCSSFCSASTRFCTGSPCRPGGKTTVNYKTMKYLSICFYLENIFDIFQVWLQMQDHWLWLNYRNKSLLWYISNTFIDLCISELFLFYRLCKNIFSFWDSLYKDT